MRTPSEPSSNQPMIGASYEVEKIGGTRVRAEVLAARPTIDNPEQLEYFVTYIGENKRWDEWVKAARILVDSEICVDKLKGDGCVTRRRSAAIAGVLKGLSNNVDPAEKEFMDKNAIRYLDYVNIGNYKIKAWYHSPYPFPYTNQRRIFHCPYCLTYQIDGNEMASHLQRCTARQPPGIEIYRSGELSIYEVFGASPDKLYCQCLCLLAKVFLDHKTLYYDVEPFIFYVLCVVNDHGATIAGYFSKERRSNENCNLSCILVLPMFQRRGYGRLLIELSYELSKREAIPGTPERPLSDVGEITYRSHWLYQIAAKLKQISDPSRRVEVSVISAQTGICNSDLIYILQEANMLKYANKRYYAIHDNYVIEELLTAFKPKLTLNPELVNWLPLIDDDKQND